MARKITLKDDEFFTKMHKLVDDVKGYAESGDIDSLSSVLDELSAELGEVREFVDFVNEAL